MAGNAMPRNLRGTPVREEDVKSGKILSVRWDRKPRYAFDTGVAMSRYLEGLREGKILGTFCRKCDRTVVPPRVFCEECFRPMDGWAEVKDTGTIATFSICYVRWDATRISKPELPAVIHLDGASEGIGIMHLLGNIDPKAVKIGLRVRAAWRPPEEREGTILDIRYFEPHG